MQCLDTLLIIGRSEFVTPELLETLKQVNAIKIAINTELHWCDYIAHIDDLKFDYGDCIPLVPTAFEHIKTPEKYILKS